ncbi:MAG: CPBP family intramembrane metalloprotease [Chloroherpetonaceae bacterium]|nr:CPBP family intramembrane metalloprotease [Chloroherpetonaceae bacterium]MDW8437854.1 CPBP family intramembrane glutamic endopeptidase [Chloroherpetonaceae bacterium]
MNETNEKIYDGFWERQGFSPTVVNFIALAILFLLYQVAGGAIAFVVAGASVTEENVGTHRLLQTLFQFLFLALPVTLLVGLHTRKFSPSDSENRAFLALHQPFNKEAALWGALGAMALNPFLSYIGDLQFVVMSDVLGLKEETAEWKKLFDDAIEKLASADSVGEFVVVALALALTPAICEELTFRGFVQRNFARAMSPAKATILTGTIFGLYHLNPVQTLPLIAIGTYISHLRQTSGALWTCVLAHFAFNFFSVSGIFILNHPSWFGLSEAFAKTIKASEPNLSSPVALTGAAISLALFILIFGRYRSALKRQVSTANA